MSFFHCLFADCLPSPAQVNEAMAYAGATKPPAITLIISLEDRTRLKAAYPLPERFSEQGVFLPEVGILFLTWHWDMPILVHEMRHEYQKEAGLPFSECDAYLVQKRYADENGYPGDSEDAQTIMDKLRCGRDAP